MPDPRPARRHGGGIGRRTLLGGAAAAGLLALGGCGIRLEDNAPDLPLVPTRSPIPAQQALLDLLAGTRDLVEVTSRWHSPLGPTLAALHTSQAEVLAAMLQAADVPESLLRPTATATTDPTAGVTTSPPATAGSPTSASPTAVPVTAADVARLEQEPLASAGTLAGSPDVMRATVAATLAQRYAAIVLAGGPPPTLTGADDTDGASWVADAIRTIVEATASAVYGFQVVTAQSTGAQRRLGASALRELGSLATAQTARLTTTPPVVLGYDLPYAVRTPAAAHRLAGHVLDGLRGAYGSQLSTLGTAGEQPFLDLAEWLGAVEVLLQRWGGTLVPFPGMSG